METVNIHEAKTQLSRLVDKAAKGAPFVIAKADKPLVKVMALETPTGARVRGWVSWSGRYPCQTTSVAWVQRTSRSCSVAIREAAAGHAPAAVGGGATQAAAGCRLQRASCWRTRTIPWLFSAVSLWEVAIKQGLGRDDFQVDARVWRRGLLDNGYGELPLLGEHAVAIGSLPPLHKDPFDRMLVVQATVEGIILLTVDPLVAQYPGPVRKV